MALRATLLLLLLTALTLVPSSPGSRGLTPDEQLVMHLTAAHRSARAALRSLDRQPAIIGAARAAESVREALAAQRSAAAVAPHAVGAIATPAVRIALQQAPKLVREARTALVRGHLDNARIKLTRVRALDAGALRAFGMPLEKKFSAFAVNRKYENVMGFEQFSGFSAKVGVEIDEVVIGAATRTTANAGESGARVARTPGLPITEASAYLVSDPIGQSWSDWCVLANGLITCRLVRATMHPDEIFFIAFAPKLPRGTKVLVKFRAVSGDRSYAIFSIR
jgi:hypothetical protein